MKLQAASFVGREISESERFALISHRIRFVELLQGPIEEEPPTLPRLPASEVLLSGMSGVGPS